MKCEDKFLVFSLTFYFPNFRSLLATTSQEQTNVEATAEVKAGEIVADEVKIDENAQQSEVVNGDKQAVDEVEDANTQHINLSSDEIEEYDAAQEKFRTLWEKKREKVS